MPDTKDFLRAFGLVKGHKLDGYTITNVEAKHIEVKRYREYQFDIDIYLSGQGGYVDIPSETHIVNSRYGNPYECWIESGKKISPTHIQMTGVAVRV